MDSSFVGQEARERITAAIEELYDGLGRAGTYPTVNAVRSKAKADMNACTAVLREWKRQQTAKPQPVAVEVPEDVRHAHLEAVAIIWSAALDVANAHLRAAEARWEQERQDAETMRRELSDAYDSMAVELDQLREEHDQMKAHRLGLEQERAALTEDLAKRREALAQQQTRAEAGERRIEDLKGELQKAHQQIEQLHQDIGTQQDSHAAELQALQAASAAKQEQLTDQVATLQERLSARTEQRDALQGELNAAKEDLASVRGSLQSLQADQDRLRGEADQSRLTADAQSREAARLGGVLQELQRQNNDLMARLTPAKPARAPRANAKAGSAPKSSTSKKRETP